MMRLVIMRLRMMILNSDEKDGTLKTTDDEDDESKKFDGETSNEDANSKFIFYSKVKGPIMKHSKKCLLL